MKLLALVLAFLCASAANAQSVGNLFHRVGDGAGVTKTNALYAGTVSVTGLANFATVSTTGQISATGIYNTGIISTTGYVTASTYYGDGSHLTGLSSGGGGNVSRTVFVGAQTTTFLVPAGVTAVKAYITSTGAAGAGATNSAWGAGAGGAAGDTAIKYISGLSAGQVISITINAAPTGTTGAGSAGAEASIQAPGVNKYYSGGASPAGAPNAGSNSAAFTSIGGNASNNAGIDCIPSPTGTASADQCIVGGSGGAAFASASNIGLSGFGGNSYWGAGGGPQTIASGLAGVTPTSCGAGGSGGTGNSHVGGGGGPGCVVLEYNAP